MLETFIIQVDETPLNAPDVIEVTELGIVIDVREEQLLNAHSPIEVTLSGILIEVRELQPLKK